MISYYPTISRPALSYKLLSIKVLHLDPFLKMSLSHNITVKPPRITQEECEIIIQKKFKNKLINYKVLDNKLVGFNVKNGFLGDHRQLIITISYNNDKKEQVYCFAKFLPDNQAQIDFSVICGVFKKEVFVYEELFPKIVGLGIDFLLECVPECYLAEDNHILVFEDVTKRGFKPLSKFEYLDYDHVLVTLTAMAKLHASSLILEEKLSEKLNKQYRLLDDYSDHFYETFYVDDPKHKGGQGVRASLKGLYTGFSLFPEENFNLSDEKFKLKVAKICFDIFEKVKPSKKYRNVICHGDLWTTNIMIKYDIDKPTESLLIDFQTARYCPPGHDFMSFIYLTTTREFRKMYFEKLQQIYYNELEKILQNYGYNLKSIISYEEFLKSCEEQKSFAIIQTVTYVQLTQAQDKWIMEYSKNVELWDEALYGDRSKMVIENCQQDPNYRHVFKEGLQDLKDFCDNVV